MNMNKLLEKQIKKYLDDDSLKLPSMQAFINAINNSYISYEKDQSLSTHAFKISEQEYAAINDQLKQEISFKRQGIKNLKEAINNIEDSKETNATIDVNEDNLVDTFGYLNEQINKRKKIEQELKNSEYLLSAAANRLSHLITNLNTGILLEDENRNIVLTNDLFCDIFSIPALPDEMKGMSCNNSAEQSKHLFVEPAQFIEGINLIVKNKILVTGDRLEMKNGRTLLRDYVPVYIANEYKGHLWKYTDITSEREREKELKRLSLVASANDNGVAFCDACGVISWANEGFTRLTGYGLEEIVGKKAVELYTGPLSDMETVQSMLQAFYEGKGFNIEVILYRKDGSWFWGRLKGQAIQDEHGHTNQYFGMLDDITIEKEKEEKLRVLSLIAEDNINAVIISNAAGEITWVNKSFVKITGYSLEEVIGKKQL